MEVTVWSLLGEDASGHITFRLPPTYLIRDLLNLYCLEKDITAGKNYVLCRKDHVILDPSKTLNNSNIVDGDVLLLTSLGKNMQLFSFGNWWVLGLVLFLIGIVGIAYILYLFFMPLASPKKSAVIIDAGSSHSQLFVFTWFCEDPQEVGKVELMHECFMPGGVADFRTNLEDLSDYFIPCLKEAESFIPTANHPKTPLVLAATAGMRLLRTYDPEGTQNILSAIREVFLSQTKFKTNSKDVYIASGQQEGINGWTALNYLLKTFQEEIDPPVSALDLGGASVQVTTELTKAGDRWPTVNITVFNNTYRLFSKSFLCYGIGEALHRHEYHLIHARYPNKPPEDANNPCLSKGLSSLVTKSDFSDPCVSTNLADGFSLNTSKHSYHFGRYYMKYHPDEFKKYYQDFEKSFRNETVLYHLKGSSNASECQKRVRALFDFNLCKRTFLLGSCLNRELVPPYKGQLFGFSSIFLRLLPLLEVTPDTSLEKFEKAVFRTCYMNASQIRSRHPNISEEMLQDVCFDSMYVYTLLTAGLGITSKRWNDLIFKAKIHKQEVAWTMGLMLNRTSSLPFEQGTNSRINLTPLILMLILFSSFLFTAGMAFFNTIRLNNRRYSYQRVSSGPKKGCLW